MTTPEALKARQLRALKWLRIEGAVLGLVLVVVGLDELYESQGQARQTAVDERQEACLIRQVTELTDALNSRSKQTGRLNDATGAVLDSFVKAAAQQQAGDADPDNTPILKALEHYAEVRKDVKVDRKANPFPPFPSGKCD